METLLAYLNSIHPLSPGLISYLSENLKTRHLQRKDFLLKIGHVSREICFISKGMLRCYYHVDDKEVSSWFMKEGDVMISVASFFNQTESFEAIQALEESVISYITFSELQFIYQNFPEFNIIGRRLTEKYYVLSEERLHALRMQRAPERYAYLRDNHGELVLRVPSKYLASYLGITEVTLSVIKGNF